MGLLKYVVGRNLGDPGASSGPCDFVQNDLGSHERWFDTKKEAQDFIDENIDDEDHEYFVMESDHPDGYEEYWEEKDAGYREQVKNEIPNAADRRKALADKLDELLQGKDK